MHECINYNAANYTIPANLEMLHRQRLTVDLRETSRIYLKKVMFYTQMHYNQATIVKFI